MEAPTNVAHEVRLLLDEMHSPAIAKALVAQGWEVIAVAAEPSLRGSSDAELLEHASRSDQILVTENVGDFSALFADRIADDGECAALIFTHPKTFNRASLAYPNDIITALSTFLHTPPIEGQSWIWWL
ncbi:MAG: hypothetical protein F4Z58_00895 [Acidimicrobiaceae bacterium]|nr:hypothetical protein [Acidimicrobiaceae bacterium]MYD05421.1 hypothetical protein [Acidimicrobiaceae bacterium]MYI59880.1 hypothetical protein [Acidimicrobiaceae bacterium]